MEEIIRKLTDKDDKSAYEFMKKISEESTKSDKYLYLIPEFVKLLQDKNSYVRTRGFILICNQSRWAKNGQIKEVLDLMLKLLKDDKPTVIRKCLAALKEVATYRVELREEIDRSLNEIDLSKYKDSVSTLIEKDIKELKRFKK